MDAQKFNQNIDIIESLNVSFYEKDLIRSAYYNHINNIPISRDANAILNKYFIVFRNGEIHFRNGNVTRAYNKKQEIENRKKLYKESLSKKQSIYNKDFTQEKVAPNKDSNILEKFLSEADSIYNDALGLLSQCENLINDESWLTKNELTYMNFLNNINTIKQNLNSSLQVTKEHFSRFAICFDTLGASLQKNILDSGNEYIKSLHEEKDLSGKLLLQLSTIKSQILKQKGSIPNDIIGQRIQDYDAYKKNDKS